MRRTMLLGTSVVASVLGIAPDGAFAQQAAAEQDAEGGLTDIVVTARKRDETLQNVPLAVTALGGENLRAAGAVDVRDLAKGAPGLFYQAADPSKPQLYIRGVGTRSFDTGSESSVATFVDGVYIGRFGGQMQNLADVERVEVLKGPQGALFGRNTIGGALSIVTHKPSEFVARASATYGVAEHFSGDEFQASVLLGGPLSGNLSAQIAYNHSQTDGPFYVDNRQQLRGGAGLNTLRGRMVWGLSDAWELDIIADGYKSFGTSVELKSTDVGGLRPAILLAPPGLVSPINPDPYHSVSTPGTGGIAREGGGVAATLRYGGDQLEFVSISAARKSRTQSSLDTDGTAFDILETAGLEKAWQLSQELRLASTEGGAFTFGGTVDWLAGIYLYRESSDQQHESRFGPSAVTVLGPNGGVPYINSPSVDVDTSSFAAFGQLGIKIADGLKLDLALRYSHDKKKALLASTSTAINPALKSIYSVNLSPTFESIDPSLTLSYQASSDVLLYASYASGYKSGAFQYLAPNAAVASVIAKPESVDAFQGGVKTELFDRRLRANLSVFHYNYKDIQVPRVETPPGGIIPAQLTNNAAKSSVKGIELEGAALLSPAFRIDYGVAHLDAKYDEYIYSATLDFSGNAMPRSPKWTFDLAASYDIPTAIGAITFRGSMRHLTHFYFEPDNAEVDAGTREPGYTTFDARITLKTDHYSIGFWGKNLGDEEYRATVLNLSGSRLREIWAPRRTMGITVETSW